MTDSDHALDAIAHAADDLLPQLTERLSRHGLGEVEVRDGELRLRVRAAPGPADHSASAPDVTPTAAAATAADTASTSEAALPVPVASPAVGFFVYADGLGPGLAVASGDELGHVEMLGVRHDVRAPRAGTVRSLAAESGEAVEYGQVVMDLEPAGEGR